MYIFGKKKKKKIIGQQVKNYLEVKIINKLLPKIEIVR